MRDLVIFGATELARMARYCAVEEQEREVAAFVVDEGYKTHADVLGVPVIEWPEMQQRFAPTETDCFIALGYRTMRGRRAVFEQVRDAGYGLMNLASPAGHIAKGVLMGENNIILPGAVLEPGVRIGSNNVIWSNATVCHDVEMGSHNFVAANVTLGGYTRLGDLNFVGFSTTILQHIAVGNETLIGAQSLVREPTRDLHRYWGVPASERGAIDGARGVCLD